MNECTCKIILFYDSYLKINMQDYFVWGCSIHLHFRTVLPTHVVVFPPYPPLFYHLPPYACIAILPLLFLMAAPSYHIFCFLPSPNVHFFCSLYPYPPPRLSTLHYPTCLHMNILLPPPHYFHHHDVILPFFNIIPPICNQLITQFPNFLITFLSVTPSSQG